MFLRASKALSGALPLIHLLAPLFSAHTLAPICSLVAPFLWLLHAYRPFERARVLLLFVISCTQVLGTLQEQMTYPDISNGNEELSKARLIELLTEVDLQYCILQDRDILLRRCFGRHHSNADVVTCLFSLPLCGAGISLSAKGRSRRR